MALNNVIAVAGATDGHNGLLIIGLALSILFKMSFATWTANLPQQYRWIGLPELLIILNVAIK